MAKQSEFANLRARKSGIKAGIKNNPKPKRVSKVNSLYSQ